MLRSLGDRNLFDLSYYFHYKTDCCLVQLNPLPPVTIGNQFFLQTCFRWYECTFCENKIVKDLKQGGPYEMFHIIDIP